MPRLLFEKKGKALWISHLDLMRLFQRAFKRAGLPLTHTQGFNPRPSVSIALPLSVGTESCCELLDFDLTSDIPCDEIQSRLNSVLVDGIKVLSVYAQGRKIRELALLCCDIKLNYETLPAGTDKVVGNLFKSDSLIVPKKTKSGVQDQDIIPMIRKLDVVQKADSLFIHTLICCQNPTLNPVQIVAAIEKYLPEMKPDLSTFTRVEIYDDQEKIFR